MTRLEHYFHHTRSPLYTALFALPLFVVYEIMALVLHTFQYTTYRNGADVMLRQFAELFGLNSFPFIIIIILVILGIIAALNQRKTQAEIHLSYFFLMFCECALYAWIMGAMALNTTNFILNIQHMFQLSMAPETREFLTNVMLSFGAGIHEEFFFRLVLIQALLFLGSFVFKEKGKWNLLNWNSVLALVLSSLLFAYFHYVGEFGDQFLWSSFVFRWVSGFYLAVIFLFRGFGMSAWSHALYDLFLLTGILE